MAPGILEPGLVERTQDLLGFGALEKRRAGGNQQTDRVLNRIDRLDEVVRIDNLEHL